MPRGDGTGPIGMGPMTGRAAGFCAGYNTPGYMNPVGGRGFGMGFGVGRGRGFGMGFGGGFGFRNRFYATGLTGWQRVQPMPAMTRTQEIGALKNQAEYLKESLAGVTRQLQELEADNKS